MEYLVRLIDTLNKYSGLFLVILTIIGFWFIYKQIKIAKNKDMCILIYKDINLCFENFTHDYTIFFEKIEEIIKGSGLNHEQFKQYFKNPSNPQIKEVHEEKIRATKKHLEQFYYELPREKLIRIIDQYQWWFDFIYYKNKNVRFHNKTEIKIQILFNSLINNINLNNLSDIHKKTSIESYLFEQIREIKKEHSLNIDSLRNETNKILSDITKKSL